jgi:hypothetical protein
VSQGLDFHRPPAEGFDLRFTGQFVQSIDGHGAGPADPVAAGPAEGQAPVLLPLDLIQNVQDVHPFLHFHLIGFVVRLLVFIGVEPENLKSLHHLFDSLKIEIKSQISIFRCWKPFHLDEV